MNSRYYKKSLFIFRRDLRLDDNIGLQEAIKQSATVILLFNFDPQQVGSANHYKSLNALQYMIESLQDLAHQCAKKKSHLNITYGNVLRNLKKIITTQHVDAVFLNLDYTSFSIKRDTAIKALCHRHHIAFNGYHDALLIGNPETLKNNAGKPYSRFAGFLKKAKTITVNKPKKTTAHTLSLTHLEQDIGLSINKQINQLSNPNLAIKGGRSHAIKLLQKLKYLHQYKHDRNFPALDATTHLSAAHKFGTISIRESYYAIKNIIGTQTPLINELYWRDFFTYIAYHAPYVFGQPFYKKYNTITWSRNKNNFIAWCTGNTGFPIVDAGMRQLNTTGWMHNRVRMIAASFLTKDLHINWQWGEHYFATQLVDYDPAVNNGNWQWVASTGADAQPYFRIFNPWLQQKKFDPDCQYIKKWLPELKILPNTIIHGWFNTYKEYKKINYPKPIVNHEKEKARTLFLYRQKIKF